MRNRVAELRAHGWLDWQIVGALFNVALEGRIQRQGIDLETFDPGANMEMLRRAETAGDEVVDTPIDIEHLDRHVYIQVAHVGMRWEFARCLSA